VRRGDTLSKIAQRYGVRERELVVINNLRSRHRIRAGQVLVLPDHASGRQTTVARIAPPADGIYRVRRGDNLSIIAQRFGVTPSALAAENGLRNRNHIFVGQRLRIPGEEPLVVASAAPTPAAPKKAGLSIASEAAKTPPVAAVARGMALPETVSVSATTVGAEIANAPSVPASYPSNIPAPDPSDYAVDQNDRITVQAAETLGHYAEWLEVRTSRLRRLNRMTYDTPVVIGRKTKLDFSRVTPETFEQRRLQYHHALQEEYFAAFEVIGTRTHTLRSGDSLWYLAERKYEVPLWLIRQFNPDLDFGALQAGTRMVIPEVGPRTS
jgi:membrane-bound lytic murein transglycosylase D